MSSHDYERGGKEAYRYNPFARIGESPNLRTNSSRKNCDACKDIFLPSFRIKSWTFWITIVQLIVFCITIVHYYQSDHHDWNCILFTYGAKFEPRIRFNYELHRIFMPIFLHGGVMHIIMNMVGQLMYSFVLEEFYGWKKFILVYFLSGIGGNLMSCMLYHQNISVGASSSLFGIFAMQIAYLCQNHRNLGERGNVTIMVFAAIILANFGSLFNKNENSNVDGGAHVGGFMTGALISFIFYENIYEPRLRKYKILAGVLLVAYLIGTLIAALTMQIPEMYKKTVCYI